MKASTTVRRRLPTATPAFDTHKHMQKHNHQRFLIFSSDSSSSFCQHVSLTSGFSLLSSSCASSSSSSMVSISRRRRRVNLVSAVVLLSCCLVLASTALSSVSAAGTFGSVCSLGSVGSFGSAVGNQLLTLTLGPAVRISQYRQIILDSWANNWSQATLQQINQFLVPVTSTSASNPNGTFGQIFYNFSQPASFPASGVAVVDLNPNRFTSFYFGKYAYNGAKHWSISCIVGLLLQNAIPLSGFNAPAMFACLQPTNQAAMCAQYPRRCDAFQQSLPLALQTAELAWRWALPLESLLPQFASEYPQATVLYQDDLGSIRTGNAQVMTYDCTLAFPANASLCSQYSLVSYYGSDSAATPAIGLSYGFAFREANAATGIPFANFTWFDPPTMNARPADIYSAYIGGEIIVVNQLSIQDPTIGVSAELAITEISTTSAYQVKLQQVLINLLGVDINQPTSAPFFYFLTDSVGKIDIAPGAAASAFMCSKYSAAARIAAGVNGSTTTGSGCNNAAQHVQYLTNTFTHIWTVNASEFAPIRSLLSIFRLATAQEYANYSGSLNNIMDGQIAQPFVSTVQNVMLDDQSYALSISGYAVRTYLSWWVVVGVPLAGYLNLQAQWSLIIPDFVATQYVDNVQQTTATAVASSSANSEISVNIQTLYFRPDDLQLPQGGGQWFIVYLNNTGLLPVSFSFSISLPNSFATNGGLTVSPRTATIPSGQTLTINLTLTGNTLMSLLGTTTPFTLVPSPSGAGLCLQPITSAITVSWRWTNQINYVGTPLMATVWVFAFLALFLVIYFIQRTIRMREDPSIKAGTWFASVIIQFHLVFLVAASMLFSLDPSSDSICQARAWMLAVGGVGVMIPLATRMWRIRRIFVQEKLKIARISHLQVFVLIVLLELLLLPVFAATIYVGSSGSALSSTLVTSSQYTDNTKFIYGQVYQCQNYETTLAAGGAIVGGLTIICSIFAWQTRSVPGAFNDAIKVVLFDLFVLAFCGIIIPLQLLLTDQVLVSALRSAGGIVVACILVLLLFTSALDHFLVVHSPDSVTFFKNESGMGNTNTQIRVKVQGKQSIVSAGQASAITGVPGTVHRGSNPSIGNAKKSNGLAPGFHTMSPPSKYTLPEVQVSGMDTNYTFTNGSSTGNGVTLIGGSGGGVGTMSGSYEVVQVAARISPQPKLAFANTTKEPSSSGGWMPKE